MIKLKLSFFLNIMEPFISSIVVNKIIINSVLNEREPLTFSFKFFIYVSVVLEYGVFRPSNYWSECLAWVFSLGKKEKCLELPEI
jgi:hypothetical protein